MAVCTDRKGEEDTGIVVNMFQVVSKRRGMACPEEENHVLDHSSKARKGLPSS
jgi:hypothetical protein